MWSIFIFFYHLLSKIKMFDFEKLNICYILERRYSTPDFNEIFFLALTL